MRASWSGELKAVWRKAAALPVEEAWQYARVLCRQWPRCVKTVAMILTFMAAELAAVSSCQTWSTGAAASATDLGFCRPRTCAQREHSRGFLRCSSSSIG